MTSSWPKFWNRHVDQYVCQRAWKQSLPDVLQQWVSGVVTIILSSKGLILCYVFQYTTLLSVMLTVELIIFPILIFLHIQVGRHSRPHCPDSPSVHHRRQDSNKSLQWRHIERDGVLNHRPHDCLLNRLFANQTKHQSPASLALVREIDRWPVNFPHKGPVTQKMFSFDGVIMFHLPAIRDTGGNGMQVLAL